MCDVLAQARLTAACLRLIITDALSPPKVATCIQTAADISKPAHVLTRFPLDSTTPVNETPKYLLSHNPGECKEELRFRSKGPEGYYLDPWGWGYCSLMDMNRRSPW